MEIPDVPKPLVEALTKAAAGQRCALVGGVVRDLLLHRNHEDPWRGLPDLDIVVEGSAAELVRRLPSALTHLFGGDCVSRIYEHKMYGTFDLELKIPHPFNEIWLVDIASARSEEYPVPAENPIVSPSSLEDDLVRRDFTINSMAIELSSMNLIDPFHAQDDLMGKQLRFLHSRSLEDDPTRIIRAARYCARLNFNLAPEAYQQVCTTVRAWPWPWKPNDNPHVPPPALGTRLRKELEKLFQSETWPVSLHLLRSWNSLQILDSELQSDPQIIEKLRRGNTLGLPCLLTLIASSADPEHLATRLDLPKRQLSLVSQMIQVYNYFESQRLIDRQLLPSEVCSLIESHNTSPQAIALLSIRTSKYNTFILPWYDEWRLFKGSISAKDILKQTHRKPGPWLGEALRKVRYKELDEKFLGGTPPK